MKDSNLRYRLPKQKLINCCKTSLYILIQKMFLTGDKEFHIKSMILKLLLYVSLKYIKSHFIPMDLNHLFKIFIILKLTKVKFAVMTLICFIYYVDATLHPHNFIQSSSCSHQEVRSRTAPSRNLHGEA